MSLTTLGFHDDVGADTWGNLPVITTPLVAITGSFRPISRPETPDPQSSASRLALVSLHADAPSASASRWMHWGAAKGGARDTLTSLQTRFIVALGALLALGLIFDTRLALILLLGLMTAVYVIDGAYKTALRVRSELAANRPLGRAAAGQVEGKVERSQDASGGSAIADGDLPIYTVLVPLHREGRILPHLVRRLRLIDYPADRLDILLLIESDDVETREALDAFVLPEHIRPLIVPAGRPRTKPRALNVGLAHARGEFLVIYDAEDRPEPDQLRKAAAAFRALPHRVICLQARLNFYNMRQSLLARLFAVDYVQWYYMLLPGLARKGAFIPLGGTSNHFRIAALRRLGGWDPFNVTEDCDLGVRVARARLEVAMLDSTTWEEAVTRLWPWIRQRSRWVKGYLQTYLVHMRHPVRLFREMGPRAFLDFQLLVGCSSLALLLNPLMWLLTLIYALSAATGVTPLTDAIHSLFPPAIYYPALLCLIAGNFIFFYTGLYVCLRQGFVGLTRYALLNPLYWALMSVGAWAGFIDLLRSPHYWAKTEHGLSLAPSAAQRRNLDEHTRGERPQLSIVIPAYNEAQRLPQSLRQLRAYVERQAAPCEVIVVDDGSTDDTAETVREWMREWPLLRLAPQRHAGKGAAIREGVLAARGEYIALMDADLSMPPDELDRFNPTLLGPYDVAIASREAPGAIRLDEPALRRLTSRVFNTVVQLALLPGIRDTQCGFKVLRREVAHELCEAQTIEGWGFDVELLYIARLRAYSIREAPVVWRYASGSKIRPVRDSLRMLRDVLKIRANGASGLYDEHESLPEPFLVGALTQRSHAS